MQGPSLGIEAGGALEKTGLLPLSGKQPCWGSSRPVNISLGSSMEQEWSQVKAVKGGQGSRRPLTSDQGRVWVGTEVRGDRGHTD